MIEKNGGEKAELVAETGFNSSPVTKGGLVRAAKKAASKAEEKEDALPGTLDNYQAFFEAAYAEGALDRKTKHLIALGASLAAGCDP
jgi:alkylhydroperoxidase/carboxymuconolactone decarboxylase family protein YurZ